MGPENTVDLIALDRFVADLLCVNAGSAKYRLCAAPRRGTLPDGNAHIPASQTTALGRVEHWPAMRIDGRGQLAVESVALEAP